MSLEGAMSCTPVVLLFNEFSVFDPDRLDPRLFTGAQIREIQGASFWKGSLEGNGLQGDPCEDIAASHMVELRPQWARFDSCLFEGEQLIPGTTKWERLKLLQTDGCVLAGARQFMPLWESFRRDRLCNMLEWFYREHGITSFDLPGDILRSASGEPRILCLFRRDDKHGWFPYWHDAREDTRELSLVLRPWR